MEVEMSKERISLPKTGHKYARSPLPESLQIPIRNYAGGVNTYGSTSLCKQQHLLLSWGQERFQLLLELL
eukprot:scaffold74000_cov34-Prasinocladus_malaysianus.AAC.1